MEENENIELKKSFYIHEKCLNFDNSYQQTPLPRYNLCNAQFLSKFAFSSTIFISFPTILIRQIKLILRKLYVTTNHKGCPNLHTRFMLWIMNQMDHRHVQYAILKHFLCQITGLHVSEVCGKQFCQYFAFYPFLSYFCPNFGEYF